MRLKECSRRVVLIWKKPEPVKYCQDHIDHTDETESTNNESTNNESVPEKMEEREFVKEFVIILLWKDNQ